ncbi:hypothetical protein GCM10025868_44560 [Angustibacter aerolatus]|uniref:Uncharacterized protein n=1 Tax=Angustibacter aerolatus TaxID=1162965 RepID=A0ABQ6JNS0_9ACTN|nr:hypothetical protein GCM10025868_44560 [Angustibacter aerolatus]
MAATCGAHQAIWSALAAAVDASTRALATRSGWVTAHSTTRMPPIEPPTTLAHVPMPRASARRTSASTWSRTVRNGKREPQARPSGATDDGPVVPWQPPSTFGATTNQRSVSSARPGPTSPSHHPGVGWPSPAGPATWLSPVSACSTSTALSTAAFSVPHVS